MISSSQAGSKMSFTPGSKDAPAASIEAWQQALTSTALCLISTSLSRMEISRISPTNFNNNLLLLSINATYCPMSSFSSSISANTPENPTMELSGVRISWDIFWMNIVFNQLLCSATSLALRSSSSALINVRFCSSSLFFARCNFALSFLCCHKKITTIHKRPSTENKIVRVFCSCFFWEIFSNRTFSALSCCKFNMVANSLVVISSFLSFSFFCSNRKSRYSPAASSLRFISQRISAFVFLNAIKVVRLFFFLNSVSRSSNTLRALL